MLRGFGATLTMLDSRNGGGSSMGYDQSGGMGGPRQMEGPAESFSQDFDDEIPF